MSDTTATAATQAITIPHRWRPEPVWAGEAASTREASEERAEQAERERDAAILAAVRLAGGSRQWRIMEASKKLRGELSSPHDRIDREFIAAVRAAAGLPGERARCDSTQGGGAC